MSEYEIVETNAQNLAGCGFCGRKDPDNEGYRRKAEWLKERYPEGLRLKVCRSRECGDIGTIEYVPGDQAWRPVEAEGYLVIHCLMVSRKHGGKGVGTLLLDSCLRDAKRSHCHGVAVVTSSDSFMAGNDLFFKAGFVAVDRFGRYELLVKKLKKGAPNPRFVVRGERLLRKYKRGLTILAADQCPMVPKCVQDIAAVARTFGVEPKVVPIRTAKASRELPTPYGTFSVIYEGKVIADRPVSGTRFASILSKALGSPLTGPAAVRRMKLARQMMRHDD